MATSNHEVADNLARLSGDNGHVYVVRPKSWTVEKVEKAWERFNRYNILSDDVPKSLDGFWRFVFDGGALWFDVVDETNDEEVGIMYLGDLIPSFVTGRFISATWHGVAWDGKAAPLRPVVRTAIRALFRSLGLHRLQAEIPACYGGAIRTILKLGFTEEGRYRSARRLNGTWYDVKVFSLLEDEVAQWAD
jgi:RimJ/RimL family protein N-acetyltransferase